MVFVLSISSSHLHLDLHACSLDAIIKKTSPHITF
nr:MAG TPA: hypothetical protein [Caudoviricetes sp.]